MAIALEELKRSVARKLGEVPDPNMVSAERIINDAGQYLYNLHSWGWRERPAYPLNYIAPISLTNATYTESSKTITLTSAFTNYTFRDAEILTISDGTGATVGDYVVAGKTSANAITLDASIGSGADGQTDIDGSLKFPYCVLPSDFGQGEIITVVHTNEFAYTVQPASLAQIRLMREQSITSTQVIYYAVSYPSQVDTATSPADALLEIYPTPSAAAVAELWLTYRSGWITLSDDSAVANVPPGYEKVLRDLCVAFAHYELNGDDTLIQQVENGPILARLKRADGAAHVQLGPTKGGHLQHGGKGSYLWNFTTTGPS